MKHPLRLPLFSAGLCLLSALALGACRPVFQRELAGPVLSLQGNAQGTRDGNSFSLTKSCWVHPGEKITTARDARLDLLLVPGVLVTLTGETGIEIEQLRLARNGNETLHPMLSREAKLRLFRGTLIGAIGESQKRSKMQVLTNAGTLTVFDLRTFKIEVDGNRTRIMSVRGNAIFQPAAGGGPVKIGAGYFAEFPAIGAEPKAAAADGQAQTEVTQLLQTEKRLFNLQKQYAASVAPWRRQEQ